MCELTKSLPSTSNIFNSWLGAPNLARNRNCHPLAISEGSCETDRRACLTRRYGSDDAGCVMKFFSHFFARRDSNLTTAPD